MTLATQGFAIIPAVLSPTDIKFYLQSLKQITQNCPKAGIRRLTTKVPAIQTLANSALIMNLVKPILGQHARLVRSIYFDKNPQLNWKVAWHQDIAIAVKKKVELKGFETWSCKEGIPHVQAPSPILEKMLTVRLHLDLANQHNGALIVSPKTHLLGRIPASQAALTAKQQGEMVCSVKAGDALLFHPLLLHSSKQSLNQNSRRIIHLEYAAEDLPPPLQWHQL